MGERANAIFPFAVAVVLPPAGVLLGLVERKEDRELGTRLIVISFIAAIVWGFIFATA
jgi:hypothetical protein